MKKRICVCLVICMLFSVLPVQAAEVTPVIALTDIPEYGDFRGYVSGRVFYENGRAVSADDWYIVAYLQIADSASWWVKPYGDAPLTSLSYDGSFCVRTVTGGSDFNATAYRFYLIPADAVSLLEADSYSVQTAETVAVDAVSVSRPKDSAVTVTPERSAPDGIFTVSPDKIAVNVDFYTDGSFAGSDLSAHDIAVYLERASAVADTVRLFGSAGALYPAYEIAASLGLKTIGTAWLSGDKEADIAELDALIEHANAGRIVAACVGSECLYRGDLTAEQLIDCIAYVRERITDKTFPVTTADTLYLMRQFPKLAEVCDFLFVNSYPMWEGVDVENAAENLIRSVESLRDSYPSKQIVVSETGWATDGNAVGDAAAGEDEAAAFYRAVRNWSLDSGIQVCYFQFADCPYKAAEEGSLGSHWGFFTDKLELKDCYADENPFAGKYWDNPFTDVSVYDSFYDAVRYCYEKKLYKGVSDSLFAPDDTMTRAMMVTVLGRLAKVDTMWYNKTSFTDVPTGEWYSAYVEWAAEREIVLGYGGGIFGVEDDVTVEQAIVILSRYAAYIGRDVTSAEMPVGTLTGTSAEMPVGGDGTAKTSLSVFADADEVSDWAADAVKWAVSVGIYSGQSDGQFDGQSDNGETGAAKLMPSAPASRAVLAEMLYRLTEWSAE